MVAVRPAPPFRFVPGAFSVLPVELSLGETPAVLVDGAPKERLTNGTSNSTILRSFFVDSTLGLIQGEQY